MPDMALMVDIKGRSQAGIIEEISEDILGMPLVQMSLFRANIKGLVAFQLISKLNLELNWTIWECNANSCNKKMQR